MLLQRGRAGLLAVLFGLLAFASSAQAGLLDNLLGQENGVAQGPPTYTNPVLAGDYPDPSVIHTLDGWYAVVTSGGWRPPFMVLHSRDLVNWDVAGHVLKGRPSWAKTDFWAPEITRYSGQYVVYYSAMSKEGQRCVGVASARRAVGYYKDRGPIVCSKLGAIDPQAVLDELGQPYLLWKEDGNAHGKPTPIMAARLTRGGLDIKGTPRELIRNTESWEGPLVEAPTLTRYAGRLYLIYSARGCCGPNCDYVTGVARSPRLFGRWEKHPGPILQGNSLFKCPGHGSVVYAPGHQQFFVYHAYSATEPVQVGRQLLIDRMSWTVDGWPKIDAGSGPGRGAITPLGTLQRPKRRPVSDEFNERWLSPSWQWPTDRPEMDLDRSAGGRLVLGTSRQRGEPPAGVHRQRRGRTLPGIVGRQPAASNYRAEVLIGRSVDGARPGLAVYGARERALGLELRRGKIVFWRSRGTKKELVLASMPAPSSKPTLRITATGGGAFTFEVATSGGWKVLGPPRYRPPFGVGVPRVVLRVAGPRDARAAFERFRLRASDNPFD